MKIKFVESTLTPRRTYGRGQEVVGTKKELQYFVDKGHAVVIKEEKEKEAKVQEVKVTRKRPVRRKK